MLHLSFLELVFRAIPESFALIFGMYIFSNTTIKLSNYIISSLILASSAYLVRFLPITYGINTIISIIVLIGISIYISNNTLLRAVRGGILSIVLLFICEGINMLILQSIYGEGLTYIFKNPTTKIIYGLPSLIIFIVILIVVKIIMNIGELSNKIATKIVVETDGDEERKSVIEYGIFAMIQTGIAIICTVIFGLLFNVLVEALIVSFSISILRKCSGGVHATSPTRCTVIGTLICILIPKLVIAININSIYSIILGIIVFIISATWCKSKTYT